MRAAVWHLFATFSVESHPDNLRAVIGLKGYKPTAPRLILRKQPAHFDQKFLETCCWQRAVVDLCRKQVPDHSKIKQC